MGCGHPSHKRKSGYENRPTIWILSSNVWLQYVIYCIIYIYIYIIPWNPCARCLKHLKTNCWPCRQKTCYKVSYQIHHIHIFPSNFWLELVMYIMKYHELSWNIPIHTPIKKIIKRSFPGLEGCDEAAGSGVHVDANLVFFSSGGRLTLI